MDNSKLRINHSRIQAFLRCRKYYEWCYVEHLKPKTKAMPLAVGDVVHRLLHMYHTETLKKEIFKDPEEYIASIYKDSSEEFILDVALQAISLLSGYLQTYKDDYFRFVGSEIVAEHELENCILFGKIDAVAINKDNELWRFEHKTTAKRDSAYLSGLKNGLQGNIYDFLMSKLFDDEIKGTVYNLLVKTKIPQYLRMINKLNSTWQAYMLETVNGVALDILKCERENFFYRSCNCFSYNQECVYRMLCSHDSKETREAFFNIEEEDLHYKIASNA